MGSTPRGSEDPRRLVATLVQYPKWRTESWPGLYANQVNGVNNDGGTTFKFNMPARLGSQRGLIDLLAPD
jgi:hypothetical protein